MSRVSAVRTLLGRLKIPPLPNDLFREQAWRTPHETMVEYEPDLPFKFYVIGVGDVDLNTAVTTANLTDLALVLHKMGSNHRLKAREWRTASFLFAFYQSSSTGVYGKRMQMLKLCDKQPAHKKGSPRQIDFELIGDALDYDDVSP